MVARDYEDSHGVMMMESLMLVMVTMGTMRMTSVEG